MRKIKFRAWDKHSGQMLKVVNVRNGFRALEKGEITTSQLFDELNEYQPMQYTGFKDAKGKEVFEGDIFKSKLQNEWGSFQTTNLAVIWCEHEGNWAVTRTPDEPDNEHYLMGSHIKDEAIIGNIYKNPELLK